MSAYQLLLISMIVILISSFLCGGVIWIKLYEWHRGLLVIFFVTLFLITFYAVMKNYDLLIPQLDLPVPEFAKWIMTPSESPFFLRFFYVVFITYLFGSVIFEVLTVVFCLGNETDDGREQGKDDRNPM